MDARVYLTEMLQKVLAMKGQDLIIKVGTQPRTRVGTRIEALPMEPVKAEATAAIAKELLDERQEVSLTRNRSVDFAFTLWGSEQRFRANIFYQQSTLSMVIRTLWKAIPTFEDLGIPAVMKKIPLERSGIVLIGGTVASGKTTTLTAMIDMMNHSVARHIITVEDPVEYLHEDDQCIINQREVGSDSNDFASALKYVVRQSPDCVVIGEMRDAEAFNFALAAAEVGRLVLATVHAKSVVQIFDRVLGFFPPEQREQVLSHLSFNITCFACQKLLHRKDGQGLVPAFEIMIGNYTTRQLAREKKFDKMPQAMRNASNEGMQTFDQSLLQLHEQGIISQEEAMKSSERPQELENHMKGIQIDGMKGKILGA